MHWLLSKLVFVRRLNTRANTRYGCAGQKKPARRPVYKTEVLTLVAVATTIATTATFATAATAATEAAGTWFHRPCFIDDHVTSIHGLAIHAADGCLRLRIAGHFHKAEALGAAAVAVHHDLGRRYSAEVREALVQGMVIH